MAKNPAAQKSSGSRRRRTMANGSRATTIASAAQAPGSPAPARGISPYERSKLGPAGQSQQLQVEPDDFDGGPAGAPESGAGERIVDERGSRSRSSRRRPTGVAAGGAAGEQARRHRPGCELFSGTAKLRSHRSTERGQQDSGLFGEHAGEARWRTGRGAASGGGSCGMSSMRR